jgi:regulator of sigma E protease
MTLLIKVLQLFLSLSILVIIHELGHFLVARLFKTRVEKFYLFFDPWFSLFKFRKGDTEYGIGWIPFGGYVKISGMIDESLDMEQMKKPPQPHEFRSKKAWKRLLIMTAGVVFNLILAMLLYICILFTWGETYLPASNAKYGIVTDSTGKSIGLRNGDKILSVDNISVDNFFEIPHDIVFNKRGSLQVDRQGEVINIELPADYIPKLLKGKGLFEPRTPFKPCVVSKLPKESPARTARIIKGDTIIGIDTITFSYYDEFQQYLSLNRGREVIVRISRDGSLLNIPVVPNQNGQLGFMTDRSYKMFFELKTIRYGFLESIPAGLGKGFKTLSDYLKQFRLIFSRHTKGYESLGGFITIGSIFPSEWDWERFWELTAFLSIILAVINILPVPALDGGHVMFTLYELITGRKPSDKFLEYAQVTGLILLLALILYANGNDVLKLLRK